MIFENSKELFAKAVHVRVINYNLRIYDMCSERDNVHCVN